jgi:trk system potassium uptake protein TrkH
LCNLRFPSDIESRRLIIRESLGVNQLGDLVQVTVGIVLVSASIQALGFLALLLRFYFLYPPAEAVWQAAFHAVSGFNNAGFSVLTEPGELMAFHSDEAILLTLAALAFLGGISYWVIIDLVKVRSFSLLTLNTKLVLLVTLSLLALGTAVFFALEYRNPQTLGPLPVEEKVLDAFFQSAMSRTTGFSSVDMGATHDQTNFFITGLMFIGGASASVAGGLKVNTLAVIIVGVLSSLRGRGYAGAFGREIPRGQVLRAMFIGAISVGFVFVMVVFLSFSAPGFQFLEGVLKGRRLLSLRYE